MQPNMKTTMENVRFDFKQINLVTLDNTWKPHFLSAYTFSFVISGKATIVADGTSYFLEKNKCFLFHPGTLMEPIEDEIDDVKWYQLSFQVYNSGNELKGLQGELFNTNPAILLNQIESLYDLQQNTTSDMMCHIERQLKFFELLHVIMKESVNPTAQKSTKEKITETIEYIEKHYSEDLSRETLASVAGLSPIYFSHAFKKEVGQSPINYLINIRMKKAKELLVTTSNRLKGIAKSVGYQDEYYFSRIFKKTVGVSPTIYIQNKRYKIFNLNAVLNGHFRALKTQPYSFLDFDRDQYFLKVGKSQISFNNELGFPPILDKIIDMKPDVIISLDLDLEKNEILRKIAPVIEIPWMEHDWRQHLLQVADMLDKTKESRIWLEKYDHKAEKASAKILKKVGQHEKVMIVMIWEGLCYLYGKRNIGNIIYNDLKLKPVEGVNLIPYNWRKRITMREFLKYQPDRLMLMVGKDRLSINLINQLNQSEEYKNLPAVKKGQVYYIDVKPWLEYSAASQENLINESLTLFSVQ